MMSIDSGEYIFDMKFQMNEITEYGGPPAAMLLSGKQPGPAVLDVKFEGTIEGPTVQGTVSNGTDYITFHPDGSARLELFATIKTHDGVNLAYRADGWVTYLDGRVLVRKTIRLLGSDARYAWLTRRVLLGLGEANLAARVVSFKTYAL
jgi:hypothetical protein